MRFGQICVILAEANRDREKRWRPFHVADFFPSLEDLRPDVPDDEEMERRLDAMNGGGGI